MKNKILILAYMGTGKTELARHNSNVVDLDFQDFKYIYDKLIRDLPLEKRKGSVSLRTENPEYPSNFIEAVTEELNKGKIVMSPFIDHVFNAVDKSDLKKDTKIILVFPMQNDFKEYEDRFKKRGNSEEFILRRKREFPTLVNLFNNTSNYDYEKITIKPNQFLEKALIEYGSNLNERMK